MNAVLKILVGVCLSRVSAADATDLCDETCLLQNDLKVSQRQKVSIATLEKEAELRSISMHREAANGSGEVKKVAVETVANHTIEDEKVDLDDEAESTDGQFSSFTETIYKQVEYELGWNHIPQPPPMKNKALLMLLEVTVVPAFFGLDRCYMNQACHGIVKGMTLGGLGLWAIIDNLAVFINAVQESHGIDVVGMRANFHKDSVHPAYVVAVWGAAIFTTLILCYFCVGMCYHAHRGQKKEYEPQARAAQSASVRYRSITHGGIGVRRL